MKQCGHQVRKNRAEPCGGPGLHGREGRTEAAAGGNGFGDVACFKTVRTWLESPTASQIED